MRSGQLQHGTSFASMAAVAPMSQPGIMSLMASAPMLSGDGGGGIRRSCSSLLDELHTGASACGASASRCCRQSFQKTFAFDPCTDAPVICTLASAMRRSVLSVWRTLCCVITSHTYVLTSTTRRRFADDLLPRRVEMDPLDPRFLAQVTAPSEGAVRGGSAAHALLHSEEPLIMASAPPTSGPVTFAPDMLCSTGMCLALSIRGRIGQCHVIALYGLVQKDNVCHESATKCVAWFASAVSMRLDLVG